MLCAATLAQAASAAEPVPAEPPTAGVPEEVAEQRAAELFQRAKASFSAGDDAAAITLLKQARSLSADPRYVFNLALVYHYAGDCPAAFKAFAEYLTLEPHGEGEAEAQRALATLQPLCGPPQERAARRQPSSPPSRAAMPPPPPASTSAPPALAWALFGGGAASTVASIAAVVIARRATADMERSYRSAAAGTVPWDQCGCRQEYQRLDARRERFSMLSWVFGLGSVSLLGAGTAVWLLEGRAEGSLEVTASGELLYGGRF